jgi:mRNA interferase RelE/StbE
LSSRELDKLDPQSAGRILRFLRDRVAALDDPRSVGQALKGDRLGEFWRYRIGDYRVIARIEDAGALILVLRIAHRREVYR